VRIRNLVELSDLQSVYELYEQIWRPDPSNPPITTEFLRALSHSGNYVAGAYLGSDLVGACTGFFASPAGRTLHSHVAGVANGVRGKNVGFALKTHQRAWALERGISVITWTFDPLVSRNAYFNVAKLGARPAEYLPNFYGKMHDGINGDGDSDRLLVEWLLADTAVDRACLGHPDHSDAAGLRAAGAGVALDSDSRGLPVISDTQAATIMVRVPHDIEALRLSAGPGARQWRMAVRQVLGGLLDSGCAVTGFDRSGWYVLQR
jgi:predicted GNAT superfamily acetyltransferase